MLRSKVAIVVSRLVGMVQLLSGGFLLGLFGLLTLMYVFDSEFQMDVGPSLLIFCLVLDSIGIMLIMLSRRTKKLIAEFKKYVSVLSAAEIETIEELAATIGKPQAAVKKNLELMIKRNYFVNAYINHETNQLIIGKVADLNINTMVNSEQIVCNCKNCGATNRIVKGNSTNCDYCGTPIKG